MKQSQKITLGLYGVIGAKLIYNLHKASTVKATPGTFGPVASNLNLASAKLNLIIFAVCAALFWVILRQLVAYRQYSGRSYITDLLRHADMPSGLFAAVAKAKEDYYERQKPQRNERPQPIIIPTQTGQKPSGILFGKNQRGAYRFDPAKNLSAAHTVVIGPTGTGKTQCVLLPTLRIWPQEFHVFSLDLSGDISREKIRKSAAYIDLEDAQAHFRFDAFGEIKKILRTSSMSTLERRAAVVDAVKRISFTMIPESAKSDGASRYFTDAGRAFLTGALLSGAFTGKSFISALEAIQSHSWPSLCGAIEKAGQPEAIGQIRQFKGIDAEDRNVNGAYGEAQKAAALFLDKPILSKIFSEPDIAEPAHILSISDIEHQDIFIKLSMQNVEVYAPAIAMIYTQFFNYVYTRPINNPAPILCLMDEFASFSRRIPGVENAFRNFRKFGVRLLICLQDFASLDKELGKESRTIIFNNCSFVEVLGASDPETQKTLADLIGQYERRKQSATFGTRQSTSFSEQSNFEYVIRPEDLAYLSRDNKAILISPDGYELLKKVFDYQEKHTLSFSGEIEQKNSYDNGFEKIEEIEEFLKYIED